MAFADPTRIQMGVHPHVITGTTTWDPKPVSAVYPRRRRFPRWRLDLPVRELLPEGHVMRATSVSAGGLYCPDVPPRRSGSELMLEIDLLDGRHPIIVTGRVVYAGTAPGGLGIGVAFLNPQHKLATFLSRLPRRPDTRAE